MHDIKKELRDLIKSVKAHMELEQEAGVKELFLPHKEAIRRQANNECRLEGLQLEALACRRCPLHKSRTNVVFGTGNPDAGLVFVGEAPGYEEDMQGLPFVGRAGELLTKIIEAMGLKRRDIYIANVLKCRPPDNRSPMPTEILSCEDYIIQQLDIIRPKVICALGKFAAQTLLRSQEPITKLRGKFYNYHGIRLIPTFHPAYLLRNPQDKKLVWQDAKKIMAELKKS